MSTSYPYLRVAKVFEVCYGKVLSFIDELEEGLDIKVKSGERKLMLWELKAYDAWRYELYRRSQVIDNSCKADLVAINFITY